MGCYRHYDEATGLYTVAFFGRMTAGDYNEARLAIRDDLVLHQPAKVLADYSAVTSKISQFDFERFHHNPHILPLLADKWCAAVADTSFKRGLMNATLLLLGQPDNIKVFSSLVDARLWLDSKTVLPKTKSTSTRFAIFGAALLVAFTGSEVLLEDKKHYLTTKPVSSAVTAIITPASTKS